MPQMAPVTTAQPDVLSVETLSTASAFDAIADDWHALEADSAAPVFFQSFRWSHFIAQTRERLAASAEPGRTAFSPRVVVVRHGGRIVLIWPLAITRMFSARVAQDLTEPFGQYSDALLATDCDAFATLDAAWREITTWRVDALLLQRVRSDANIAGWLNARGHRVGEPREAPFVGLSTFPDFDAYHRSIRAKTRKNLRNYRNRLARTGALQHRLISDVGEIHDLTRLCLTWRSDWLSASGLSSAAFQHVAFERVIEGLASGSEDAPPLQLMMLALERGPGDARANGTGASSQTLHDRPEDRIVAIQWGFRHGDRYYAFMSAKNPSFDAFSPGRLHLEDVIATCAAEGIATVDMLVPRMAYKDTWATGAATVDSFGLANSMRGRLIVDVWHNIARPALKSAALRLPPGLRRLAFGENTRLPPSSDHAPTK